MRITQEADYALRIVCLLAEEKRVLDATTISEEAHVTPRFALKILRKLVLGGMVRSRKGASGGYELAKDAEEVSMKDVIELIDGEIAISKCLMGDHVCSKQGTEKNACAVHRIFDAINQDVSKTLAGITIASVIAQK